MSEQTAAWERYLCLMKEREELFLPSEALHIITDPELIRDFSERTGRRFGVLYQSPYSMLVVDLVEDGSGKRFAYERVVPTQKNGIVCMPVYDGKFLLLRQYRHSLRERQWGFPRGFGEQGLSAEENLRKEVQEEIVAEVLRVALLGYVAPDSGLLSSKVSVFCCEITEPALMMGYEGIDSLCLLSKEELAQKIRDGEITDGFTLSAFALYTAHPVEQE